MSDNDTLTRRRPSSSWLVREHYLAEDPSAGLKRAKVPQGFSASVALEDLDRVLGALALRPPGWQRVRDAALVLVPFSTGLRVSELRRLDTSHVDTRAALLRQALRKDGSTTDVLLHRCAVRVLTAWLRIRPVLDHPALFVGERDLRLGVRASRRSMSACDGTPALPGASTHIASNTPTPPPFSAAGCRSGPSSG